MKDRVSIASVYLAIHGDREGKGQASLEERHDLVRRFPILAISTAEAIVLAMSSARKFSARLAERALNGEYDGLDEAEGGEDETPTPAPKAEVKPSPKKAAPVPDDDDEPAPAPKRGRPAAKPVEEDDDDAPPKKAPAPKGKAKPVVDDDDVLDLLEEEIDEPVADPDEDEAPAPKRRKPVEEDD